MVLLLPMLTSLRIWISLALQCTWRGVAVPNEKAPRERWTELPKLTDNWKQERSQSCETTKYGKFAETDMAFHRSAVLVA